MTVHGGYPESRNVRYASHNMAHAQGAKNRHVYLSIETASNKTILVRRPNLSHLVEMRCYWWPKNRRVDRNVRSVHAAVNRNLKYRWP